MREGYIGHGKWFAVLSSLKIWTLCKVSHPGAGRSLIFSRHARTLAYTGAHAPHVRASLTDYTLLGKRKRVSVANDGRMWIGVSPKGERNDHILSLGWPLDHPLERMFHYRLKSGLEWPDLRLMFLIPFASLTPIVRINPILKEAAREADFVYEIARMVCFDYFCSK